MVAAVDEGTTQLDQVAPRSYDIAFERRTAGELLVHVGAVVSPFRLQCGAPRRPAQRQQRDRSGTEHCCPDAGPRRQGTRRTW